MTAVPFDTLKLAKGLEAGGFLAEQAIAAADLVTKADLRDLEQRLTIRFGGMLAVAVGVLLAAIRYLPAH